MFLKYYTIFVICFLLGSCAGEDHSVKPEEIGAKVKNYEVATGIHCYKKRDIDLPDSTRLDTILNRISELKEVRDYSVEIGDLLSYCVFDDKSMPNRYIIRVGLEDEEHLSTRFFFYVDKLTGEMTILEPISGNFISIDEWRAVEMKKIPPREMMSVEMTGEKYNERKTTSSKSKNPGF